MSNRLQPFTILELMILEKALEAYVESNEGSFTETVEETLANAEPFHNVSLNLKNEINQETARQTAWVDPDEVPVEE